MGIPLDDFEGAVDRNILKMKLNSLPVLRDMDLRAGLVQHIAADGCGLGECVPANRDIGHREGSVLCGVTFGSNSTGFIAQYKVDAGEGSPGLGIGLDDGDRAAGRGVGDAHLNELAIFCDGDLSWCAVQNIAVSRFGFSDGVGAEGQIAEGQDAVFIRPTATDSRARRICQNEVDAG